MHLDVDVVGLVQLCRLVTNCSLQHIKLLSYQEYEKPSVAGICVTLRMMVVHSLLCQSTRVQVMAVLSALASH